MALVMSVVAYVDESEPDVRFSGGLYLLAAALVADHERDAVSAAVAALRLSGQRKLHWRDEGDRRRKLLVAAIAELPALHVVVFRVAANETAERRRRLCLRTLLCQLDADAVPEVRLESREAKQNARDVQLLGALRAQRAVGGNLRMFHSPGPADPLLWVPDVVAGAVGAERRGDASYVQRLDGLLSYYKVV